MTMRTDYAERKQPVIDQIMLGSPVMMEGWMERRIRNRLQSWPIGDLNALLYCMLNRGVMQSERGNDNERQPTQSERDSS